MVFLGLIATNLFAQDNLLDTIKVPEIEIVSNKIENFAVGGSIQKINPQTIENSATDNVSSLLSKNSSVIINSYGIGGVSSPIIRGGSSSQTAIMWNGMNLQSPLTGGVNLSVMPVFMFDNISVQYGGSATLFGSGNVNGAIHLNSSNTLNVKDNVSLMFSYGSFNNRIAGFSSKVGNEKIATQIKIFTQLADNDFKFLNTAKINDPYEYQTHAGLYQHGICNETMFKTSHNSFLKSSLWYQYYDKDIQTMMTVSDENSSNQKDEIFRYSLNWQYFGEKSAWNVTSGLINDHIHYVDSEIEIAESNIRSYSFVNEIENKLKLYRNHSLNTGLNYSYEIGKSDGLIDLVKRNRISLFSTYRLVEFKKKLNAALSFRSELVDDKFIPSVYSLGLDYDLNIFSIKGNVAKNYRLPTFNDLYWRADNYASGNPDLKPESGISGNIGISKTIKQDKLEITFSEIAFYSHLYNWIVWLPNSQGVWMPENKKEGINRGLETQFESKYNFKKSQLGLDCNYSYTKSQSLEVVDSQDVVNESLYVPNHKISGSLIFTKSNFSIRYTHNYFSQRFYDYIHILDAYQIADISFSYHTKFQKNELVCSFQISNLWNKDYQVIAWYAMPLRNFKISINYKL